MINPDMRYIEPVIVENTCHYASKTRLLCDHCGRQGRCLDEAGRREIFDHLRIKSCHRFIPIFAFRPPLVGFEDEFNTFRMGTAWARRIFPGSVVTLLDTKSESLFAAASVTRVYSGSIDDMATLYAAQNHLAKAGLIEKDNAAQSMKATLRKMYGNLIYSQNKNATVVFMKVTRRFVQATT
ncbi:hypothetical protein [Ectothiorhodospira shaposhnikovii]|uniref:hypothetical protein n=1 Tax=Ectothiorhodospira shaposhnikovii TaxID=1054 RepID=UPI001EE8A6B9|nr:hypothetical protein [Ectothiorhodospira shaposhnikovii]MCG5512785.1 hypothetical protein [Ectothiorhodospira shaposhnikovii]